jgi:hypothetical protein
MMLVWAVRGYRYQNMVMKVDIPTLGKPDVAGG